MKHSLLIYAILYSSGGCFGQIGELESDANRLNIKGSVKSISQLTFDAVDSNGTILKGSPSEDYEFRKSEIDFSLDGRIMKSTVYYAQDTFIYGKTINSFNTDSTVLTSVGPFLTKTYYFNSENKIDSTTKVNKETISKDYFKYGRFGCVYIRNSWKYREKHKGLAEHVFERKLIYNKNGQIVKEKIKSEHSNRFKIRKLFKYEDGLLIQEESGDQKNVYAYEDTLLISMITKTDSELVYKTTYTYDSSGILIGKQHFDLNAFLNRYGPRMYFLETWNYDSNGNVLENVKSFFIGKEKSVENSCHSYEYIYDNNKNWIRRIDYFNDNPIRVVERAIEYY